MDVLRHNVRTEGSKFPAGIASTIRTSARPPPSWSQGLAAVAMAGAAAFLALQSIGAPIAHSYCSGCSTSGRQGAQGDPAVPR
ncbi:hypothetical protein B0H67DRAFT_640779 [Lasiosphaeris hirsuta]|uniref:Uncharacterized protein n=1 Tax=Lasiosphaeris hirsuta TaxID=260670 RepID=A0AA40AY93_9PEZI|nr:hypothetical protein B0H67DRAFT_640779 [Lasiosphaeris hirsuta]